MEDALASQRVPVTARSGAFAVDVLMGAEERANHAAMLQAGIPIVGQPFTIVEHYPTVIIQCQCEAKKILTLIGAGSAIKCPSCEKVYGIGAVGKVQVGQVVLPEGAPV